MQNTEKVAIVTSMGLYDKIRAFFYELLFIENFSFFPIIPINQTSQKPGKNQVSYPESKIKMLYLH